MHNDNAAAGRADPGLVTSFLSGLMEFGGRMMVPNDRMEGGISVILPSGKVTTLGNRRSGPVATMRLNNFRIVGEAARRGAVGFAECYMRGDIDVDNLTGLFRFFVRNKEKLSPANPGFLRRMANDVAYHLSRRNTREGSKRNISEHYDLGNEFYAEWLDPTMTYSSAVFAGEDEDLQAAQLRKYRKVAEAAEVAEGGSVLEVGCGWGGFAEVATSEFGANLRGITLSREQLDFATRRMERIGQADRAELVFEDYRDTKGTFDSIASIEMIEAVGEEHWPHYFSMLFDRLKAGGTAAIQAITIRDEDFEEYRNGVDFIQRYVFPGGMLMTRNVMRSAGEAAGLVLEQAECFGQSYARTLALWRQRFLDRWHVIRTMGFDERFRRRWLYYLSYCEAGFAEGTIDVGIYKYRRPETSQS